MQLFCFPFAGGSYYSYYPLKRFLNPRINLIPLDLPGHGRRMQEPLLSDLNDMCNDVYKQIDGELDNPYAFLGHSMGALIGYLLTQKITRMGFPGPSHLFATGRQGPPRP